jgi:hypothetical protein
MAYAKYLSLNPNAAVGAKIASARKPPCDFTMELVIERVQNRFTIRQLANRYFLTYEEVDQRLGDVGVNGGPESWTGKPIE